MSQELLNYSYLFFVFLHGACSFANHIFVIIFIYACFLYNKHNLEKRKLFGKLVYYAMLFLSVLAFFIVFVLLIMLFFYNSLIGSTTVLTYEESCFVEMFSVYCFAGSYYFCPDVFGLVLALIAIVVGFISFFTLDSRSVQPKWYFSIIFLLMTFIFFFVIANHTVMFFFCYEMLLLPSFALVYLMSPNRRGVNGAFYFLIWTQLGSLLVLIFILYISFQCDTYSFTEFANLQLSVTEKWWLYFILFVGFGIKIPIWPFHFWLTKTHVEAPTGFSIFLSGFLVKSALLGFYKFTSNAGLLNDLSFFITISALGVIDASFKMWGQVDLKKLVAYGTIQEMNLILLAVCYNDSFLIFVAILFCITHAALSTLFFYYVDCIYRRFKSRSIVEIQGLAHTIPNFSMSVFFGCLCYSGLPGTLKFVCEVCLFSGLFAVSPSFLVVIVFIANYFGLLGFCKCWYTVLFGANTAVLKSQKTDLTNRELFIQSLCFFVLLVAGYWLPWF